MEYNWEKNAAEGIMPHIIDLNDEISGKYKIMGFAVANIHNAEACFMPMLDADGVLAADLYLDVLGDVTHLYGKAVEIMGRDLK